MVFDAIEQMASEGGAEAEHEGAVFVLVALIGLGRGDNQGDVFLTDPLAPLLDEEGNASGSALIAQAAEPVGMRRAGGAAGLAANNQPRNFPDLARNTG